MPGAPDPAPLKERQRQVWSQGHYDRLASEVMPVAEALAEAAGVAAGERVLDVAAGTGNAAVAAARRGARVVASDLTPRMLELGRVRSEAEGLAIDWVEADAEALPFADGRFDRVLSSFGVMFAPRPELAAGELFRVVRPGGTVALANWTPESFPGRLLTLFAARMPPPPGVPRPVEWGREEVVRARLRGLAAEVRVERRAVAMAHSSPEALLDFRLRNSSSLVVARETLGDRFADLVAEIGALIAELNLARDGSARLEAAYLQVVAARA